MMATEKQTSPPVFRNCQSLANRSFT
uniref:Uncharacterized protein n=1 Tax=Rhizophora mucronata TaxID=61149 RepID=A0A2P2Q1H6_RHIMU